MSDDNISSFEEAKKKKDKEEAKSERPRSILSGRTAPEFMLATDAISEQWEFYLRNDTLNEYLHEYFDVPIVDWTSSLDLTKQLQEDICMDKFIVHAPRTTIYNPVGWLCAFNLPDDIIDQSTDADDWDLTFSTPAMESEILCRLFATLLYTEYSKIIREIILC